MATPVPVVSIMYFLLSVPPKISDIVSPAFSAISTKLAIDCVGEAACFVTCANNVLATGRTKKRTAVPAMNCQKERAPGTGSMLTLDTIRTGASPRNPSGPQAQAPDLRERLYPGTNGCPGGNPSLHGGSPCECTRTLSSPVRRAQRNKSGSSGKIGFPHVISWGYNPTVTSGMFWHSCNSCDCISSCTRSFHQRGDYEGCCEVYAPDVISCDDFSSSGLFASRKL